MRKLSAASHPFERCIVTPAAAAEMFAGNKFKMRVIDAAAVRGEQLSVYRCGPFVDLCRSCTEFDRLLRCFEFTFLFQGSPRAKQQHHRRCSADIMLGSASSAASEFFNVAMSASKWNGCSQPIGACSYDCCQRSGQNS